MKDLQSKMALKDKEIYDNRRNFNEISKENNQLKKIIDSQEKEKKLLQKNLEETYATVDKLQSNLEKKDKKLDLSEKLTDEKIIEAIEKLSKIILSKQAVMNEDE